MQDHERALVQAYAEWRLKRAKTGQVKPRPSGRCGICGEPAKPRNRYCAQHDFFTVEPEQ